MKRMRFRRWALGWLSFLAMSAVVVTAQQPQLLDTSKIGPKLGDVAPEFSGSDQNGIVRSLKASAGRNGTMLVFFRSADW